MKRALALILAFAMVFCLIPAVSLAAGGNAALMSTVPQTGDQVVIYTPAYSKALNSCGTAASYYNAGYDITPAEGTMSAVPESIIWDVTLNADGSYCFSQDGKKLSMDTSYSSTPYDKVNDKWTLETATGGYYIKNVGRACYLEWYNSSNYYSGYYNIAAGSEGMFTMQFYKVEAAAVEAVEASPAGGIVNAGDTVTLTCATEGATIYYKIDDGAYVAYSAPVAITAACKLTAYAAVGADKSAETNWEYTLTASDGTMSIYQALNAGAVTGAKVVGQLVYRFGNYGSVNSAVLQSWNGEEICALQVYNSLDSYTDGTPINLGDWVVLTGTLGAYGGVQQIQSLTDISAATAAQKGKDASAAQVFESVQDVLDNFDSLLTEYVYIKNVKLGEYSSTGTTTVTDAAGTASMGIYRAADYSKWFKAGDVVNIYCAVSKYSSTKQLRNGTAADYVMTAADTEGPVITLPTYLDAEVGVDYTVNAVVEDYSAIASVSLKYVCGTVGTIEMTAGDDGYSAVIPGSDIVGGGSIAITITAIDVKGNSTTVSGTINVVDLPQITAYTPASNEATGTNKRPVISVTIANGGENPTIAMTLNGEAITLTKLGSVYSYTPTADMADGKYTAAILITRADGKTADLTWSFTVGEATYSLYFGQLHSHTAQYSDGTGTLDQAYTHAKYEAEHVDFLAVTDHSNYFDTSSNLGDMTDPTKGTKTADGSMTLWQQARATAATYTDDSFVALYGYEMTWSGQYGHMNTFNSVGIESRNNSTYVVKNGPGLVAYYDRLVEVANTAAADGGSKTINQFNHPGTTFGTFEDFAHYTAAYDELITMVEVGNGEGKVGGSMYWPSYEYYTLALDKGWHLAPTNNQDNHKGGWGDSNTCRDVIYTDNFTEEGIYQAMRDMTMYSTEDNDLEIIYTLNGNIMGSVENYELGTEISIDVSFNDPTDRVSTVSIITNGGTTLAKKSFNSKSGSWNYKFTLSADTDYSYFYIRIDEADSDIAVTAPVWVKDTTKIGITSLTKDNVSVLKNEDNTFTLTVYNYEQSAYTVEKVAWMIDGVVKYTDKTAYTVDPESENSGIKWTYKPNAIGYQTLSVEVTANYNGTSYTFTATLSFTVRDASEMKTMLIDAHHVNFYVSGNYADSDTGFIELAADYNVSARHLTEALSDETLAGCDLLVLTVPYNGKGVAITNSLYTDDEIAALKRYADKGGNIIITSKSDRSEPAAADEKAAVISNELLEAVGAKARVGSGIVADVVNQTNETYRLHFIGKEYYNFAASLCDELIENTNLLFSAYNAAPIILNGATPVVKAFPTSFVSSYDTYYTGSAYKPNPETERSASYYAACGDQTDIVVLAQETLPGGGFCVTAGVTFFSTFEVKVEVESASTLQNSNYQICVNLFKMLNPETVTAISKIHETNKEGLTYTIEGYVTANASGHSQETAFFDCIYVQDESGRGINVFPVAGNYQVGQKVRVTGMTSSYMGEIELNCGNAYGGYVRDITLSYAERAELEAVAITVASSKQDVDQYVIDDSALNAKLDVLSAANRIAYVEPNGDVSDTDALIIDKVTTKQAASKAYVGNLVEFTGKVTAVEYDSNGVIGAIKVSDGSGTVIVFIDGYIDCDENCVKDQYGYHDLSAITVGCGVTVRGIASIGQNSYTKADQIGARIRVRDRSDIRPFAYTTELEKAIAYAAAFMGSANYDKCSDELKEKWQAAYDAAIAVMNNGSRTQLQCDNAVTAIRSLKKTGESTLIYLWIGIGVWSICGLAFVLIRRRRFI